MDNSMSTRDPQEFKLQALERLKNGDEMDEIILQAAQELDIPWQEASELVTGLYEENKDDITLYQSPILVFLAFVIFLGGVGLLGYTAYNVYEIASHNSQQAAIILLTVYGESIAAKIILGLGMVIGSLKGMQDIWESVFRKIGIL
jgi:hypothetical protein